MNLLSSLMKEQKLDLQGAYDHAATMVRDRVQIFVNQKTDLSSLPTKNTEEIKKFVDAAEYYSMGFLKWYYETDRYVNDDICSKFFSLYYFYLFTK